ncbi:MAG: hypothetical protein WD795_13875 [Woeseia sp.]
MAFEPGSLYEEGKISRGGAGFGNGAGGPGTGRVFRNTTKNEVDLFEYWVTAGGPIIEDRLFFYGIVNPRETEQRFQSETNDSNEFAAPDQFSVFDYPASTTYSGAAKSTGTSPTTPVFLAGSAAP